MCVFNDNFSKLLDKLSYSKRYLTGDFNINLLNHDKHFETEHFLNNIFSHFFSP
jgi:hypothetical protein